jgi:hypothetical protein
LAITPKDIDTRQERIKRARREKMEKKCQVCKKAFTTFDTKAKYCGTACAKKAGKAK